MNNGFRSFPEKLFQTIQKISPKDIARFFGKFPSMQGRGEIFYTIKEGDWTDPTIWETVSGRGEINGPGINDDVYIRHNTTWTINTSVTINCKNFYVAAGCYFRVAGASGPAKTLNVFGNMQCIGTYDVSTQSTGASINLYGSNNRIDNYTSSYNANNLNPNYINYVRSDGLPQPILSNINYDGLGIGGSGVKSLTGHITATNVFTIGSTTIVTLDAGGWNATIGTLLSFNNTSTTIRTGGLWTVLGTTFCNGTMNFSVGQVDFEFRGDVSTNGGATINTNSLSTWIWTTNSSTITINNGPVIMNANWIISGAINTSLVSSSGSLTTLTMNTAINGTVAGSTFTNKGFLYFGTSTAGNSMTTGILDIVTFSNTIGYNYNGSGSIYQTSFSSLAVYGTGTKSAIGNLSLSANLNMNINGNSGSFTFLELGVFNISVTGTTTLNAYNTLSKTGSGSVLFTGQLISDSVIPFAFTGNPTVELMGGALLTNTLNGSDVTMGAGTGLWSFTTNSQLFRSTGSANKIFANDMSIVGAITVTFQSTNNSGISGGSDGFSIPSINGTVAGSTLINKSSLKLISSTATMTTGTIDFTSFANVVGYHYNGNGTIPLTSYYSLSTAGTGTKTLGGSTTLLGNLYVTTGKLELSTFDLTIAGTTTLGSTGNITKSGSGNVIFGGLLSWVGQAFAFIDFSAGNPTVEFKGGITINNSALDSFKLGTNTTTFSTNSQTLTFFNLSGFTKVIQNMLISGAITVTISASNDANMFEITTSLNGDNASSTLDNRGYVNYKGSATPMTTGILQTNAAANTFIYGNGNQNILGGASLGAKQVYRTLTLNGTGTKTLQGYVSVINTYTLTSPATLNNNGFTLTNP